MINHAAKILLVDDHELVRSTFQDFLNRIPEFEVVAAVANRKDALNFASCEACDLALIDINLQGELGTNLALDIRRLQPNTKIVFISATIYDRYVDQAIAMDADGFISKRDELVNLVKGLQTVLRGKPFYSKDVLNRLAKCPKTGHTLRPLQTRRTVITPRQIEILKHIARGASKKEIAQALNVAVKTIDCHCDNMMRRLDLHDRVALTRYAVREGFIEP
ncbi:MAG TPA: response regulator transcription factor [Phycisphaerae bacterium]|nr:response regulator transcription factor [Phycisphaerae bacterium]